MSGFASGFFLLRYETERLLACPAVSPGSRELMQVTCGFITISVSLLREVQSVAESTSPVVGRSMIVTKRSPGWDKAVWLCHQCTLCGLGQVTPLSWASLSPL